MYLQDESANVDHFVLEPAEYEEIAALDGTYISFRTLVQEVLRREDSGEIDPIDSDATLGQAAVDFNDEVLDALDLEEVPDEELAAAGEDMANMSGSTEFASFAQGFGAATAGLIDQLYETAEDGVADLASVSGLDDNTVYGILGGELVPSVDIADAFANVFPILQEDERAYQEYIQLASQANAEVDQPEMAQMGGVDHQLRAEFAQMQQRQIIADKFREIERECDRGLNQEWLTPAEFSELMGNFQERDDRVACFSQFCSDQGVDPFNQLDKMDYVLYFLERRGPMTAMFSQISDGGFESEPLSQEDINTANEYRIRNGYE